METRSEFDSLRPYNDAEAREALGRVAHHPAAAQISQFLFPEMPGDTLSGILLGINGVDDFQRKVMDPVVARILERTTDGFTCDGIERLQAPEGKGCHLFLSNHRDIVLDPAITQEVMVRHDLPTTEICVGDNLLENAFVEDLIRSNRMVKVSRGVTGRQLYDALSLLSRYIRESVTSGRSSVWLAQRQGRTKDGNDATEEALLKMLAMSGGTDFTETFLSLRIVPLSISYEYEPCDILKARETLIRQNGAAYVKQPGEDLHSIVTGIKQPKGRVHLRVCEPLTEAEIAEAAAAPRTERFLRLAELLDSRILGGYHLWPTHYIACDLLNGDNHFSDHYTKEEKEKFVAYMHHKLTKVEPELDREALKALFLRIYANPLLLHNLYYVK